jgi:hypothetical protein
MSERTIRTLIEERIDGSIESILWHTERGGTRYGLVASLDSGRVSLSTLVLDMEDETLRIHGDNSMWLPAETDVLDGTLRSLARATSTARGTVDPREDPIEDSLIEASSADVLSTEIEDAYDPDSDSSGDWKAREGRDGIEEVREILAESEIEPVDRFIRLEMEGKAPWSGDPRRIMRSPPEIAGNYGIEVSEEDDLVILDVDEVEDAPLDRLPETLRSESPHDGEHRFYRVPEWLSTFRERFDGTLNPHPEWGEVRSQDGYVVGPGSILSSCKYEDCCSEEDPGRYVLDATPIATIDADVLADLLAESRGEEVEA